MRNTLIELDMIFIAADGVVKHIHHRAQPLDETPIVGGRDLTHVLEINGGLAEQFGIDVGSGLGRAVVRLDGSARGGSRSFDLTVCVGLRFGVRYLYPMLMT